MNYIGIDLGGTRIKIGLVKGNEIVDKRHTHPNFLPNSIKSPLKVLILQEGLC